MEGGLVADSRTGTTVVAVILVRVVVSKLYVMVLLCVYVGLVGF